MIYRIKQLILDVLCACGVHWRVWEGGGGMGDALRCQNCGRDKYPEVFGVAIIREPLEKR